MKLALIGVMLRRMLVAIESVSLARQKKGAQYFEGDILQRFMLIKRAKDVPGGKEGDYRWVAQCRVCGSIRISRPGDLLRTSEKCLCHKRAKSNWRDKLPKLLEKYTVAQISKKLKRQEGTIWNAMSRMGLKGSARRLAREATSDAKTVCH